MRPRAGGSPGGRALRELRATRSPTFPCTASAYRARPSSRGACPLSVFTYMCIAESEEEVKRRLAGLTSDLRLEMRRVDRWIVGTREVAYERLASLARSGAQRIFLAVWDESHRRMLELLATDPTPVDRTN